MQVFYTHLIENGNFTLDSTESHHCIHVLRMKQGDKVHLFDGLGGLYLGQLMELGKEAVRGHILSKNKIKPKNYHLTLAVSPTKSIDRFEWFVEKAIEIGVDLIVPLMCKRTERKSLRLDRLEKIAVSAMKQSLNPWLTQIQEPTDFMDFTRSITNVPSQKFIAYMGDEDRCNLLMAGETGKEFIVLIGPEGDFSPDEIAFALDHKFIPVSLGMNRLRTETAAVVSCQIMASRMYSLHGHG